MKLLFGSQVRSGGRRIGYLAGAEIDASSRRVTKIVFSGDGKLGSHAQTRSIDAVRVDGSHIIMGDAAPSTAATAEPLLWSSAIRFVRGGRDAGHLAGVVVGDKGAIESVVGRHHWWSGRAEVPASEIDLSRPGEVRAGKAASQAA
jgi:hypothetical protein